MLALVDINNCYIAIQRLFDSTLENVPVIVVSNNDGCAVARSTEAKQLGIKMGEPIFKIKDVIEKHEVKVLSSNYPLYADLSARFVALLEQFTPDVEQYSIDESFLSFDGFERIDLTKHCQNLVHYIHKNIGLPVCVGIAPTYTLAKVANHYAKSLSIPGNVLNLSSPYHRQQALKLLPVEEVWGIGRQTKKRLASIGIFNAWELSQCDLKVMQRQLGVVIERTILELRGIPAITLKSMEEPRKEIVCGRSFGTPITTSSDLKSAIAQFIHESSKRLRKQQSFTSSITVFLRTNPFNTNDAQYSANLSKSLPVPENDTRVLLNAANHLTEILYKPGFRYKKAGIMLQNLSQCRHIQTDLFTESQGSPKLMTVLDNINAKYGNNTLQFGAANLSSQWVMNQSHLSPKYTTQWSDLMKVYCR